MILLKLLSTSSVLSFLTEKKSKIKFSIYFGSQIGISAAVFTFVSQKSQPYVYTRDMYCSAQNYRASRRTKEETPAFEYARADLKLRGRMKDSAVFIFVVES